MLQRLPALLVRLRLLRRSRLLHLSHATRLLRPWLHIRSHHHLIRLMLLQLLLLLLLLLHSHHRLLLLLWSIRIPLHSTATATGHNVALHHLLLIRIGRSQSTTAAALIRTTSTSVGIPRPLVHRQEIAARTARPWSTTAHNSSHATRLLLLLHLRSIRIARHSSAHMATHRSLNAWRGHLNGPNTAGTDHSRPSRTNNATAGTNIPSRRHHFPKAATIGHLLPCRLLLHLLNHLQHIRGRRLSRQLLLLLHADARLMVWTTHSADRRGNRRRWTHSSAGPGSIHSAARTASSSSSREVHTGR